MKNKKIVSFPRMGKYTYFFKEFLEELGINVLLSPETSDQSIKFGCKHSSDMMCFPFKVNLGNFRDAIDQGANALVMWDSRGQCRLRHYYIIQEYILKNLDYKFEMYPLSISNFFSTLKKLNPSLTSFKIIKTLPKQYKKLKEIDKQEFKPGINIGIIGEIFTCLEPRINFDIEHKLSELGANSYNTVTVSDFLREALRLDYFSKIGYKKEAEQYLNGPLGGHGFENIYNLLWLKDKKIDGVIHLLPLSCMPETTVEPIINDICERNKVPLLRLTIDETNSKANVDTRVETFVELIKRKKCSNRI